eukprot:CAMPEP_0173402696 /NCGR_PEP_ID=MMETSP1356-20130122/54711_1 /TAXON_ID=77927 ORGANISM="Hemiselmis virescens, Strain PCC157" /NCGR_SAMPLE_ID=MMETSP1356 /ASSEMBLY_ACC=CAM_ASM_000847 /LENGTH=131 /DNA_ID=CAMNT_0014363085 /DNA_START=69 /DNA_END=461 /DNA_ORIENTATION=-
MNIDDDSPSIPEQKAFAPHDVTNAFPASSCASVSASPVDCSCSAPCASCAPTLPTQSDRSMPSVSGVRIKMAIAEKEPPMMRKGRAKRAQNALNTVMLQHRTFLREAITAGMPVSKMHMPAAAAPMMIHPI